MLYVPSIYCMDNVNTIVEFVPNASESVFFHKIYCNRDSVFEAVI